jgi:hypothetical protein
MLLILYESSYCAHLLLTKHIQTNYRNDNILSTTSPKVFQEVQKMRELYRAALEREKELLAKIKDDGDKKRAYKEIVRAYEEEIKRLKAEVMGYRPKALKDRSNLSNSLN